MFKQIFAVTLVFALLLAACTPPVAPAAEEAPAAAEATTAESENPYLESITRRQNETFDAEPYAKEGPYRIAFAAQGPTNAWATLFDEHVRHHVEELGDEVVSELIYADANGSADIQVPQVEDLLSQEPDALILVPMGRAALSAPTERAMAQGVPVILCASGVETDNFATEVGTNLYASGAELAQFLVDELAGSGNVVQMNGIPGVDTAETMALGAESVWAENPDINILDVQYGNWSTAEAKKLMEQWIAQHGEEIDGIWSGGAQMSQGIIEAYLEAGLPIPPIGGGEFANGFLRLAKEEKIDFWAWQYPNAMGILCLDTAIKILQGESVPRFIDLKDEMENTQNFGVDRLDEYYNPNWSDDVSGPIFLPEEKMKELGYSQ